MRSGFRRPSLRRALVIAGIVVVGGVALGLASSGGDQRDGATERDEETTTTAAPVPIERAGSDEVAPVELRRVPEPEHYEIAYRVTERGGDVTTEDITVVRPFLSEATIRRDGAIIGVQRSAFGRILSSDGAGDDQAFAIGPGVAGGDVRIAAVLDAAVDQGRLEAREQREVAGRRCQVYRAATSILGGTLPPLDDAGAEHADVCIDGAGLLLEEWWVVDGAAIRHRVAVEVDLDPPPPSFGQGWSDVATTLPLDRGGGSILRLREGSAPPGPFFDASVAVPAGYEHVGRFSVIPPQAAAFSDEAERGSIVASTADVWVRGADLLVIDQGGTLEQQRVYEVDPDNEIVPIPGVGDAEVLLTAIGPEIRVLRPAGRFIRVFGTMSPDELLTIARGLVEGVGNELVVDDGPLLRG